MTTVGGAVKGRILSQVLRDGWDYRTPQPPMTFEVCSRRMKVANQCAYGNGGQDSDKMDIGERRAR